MELQRAEQEQAVGQHHLRSNLEPQQNSHIPGEAQAVSPRCLTQPLGCKDGYTGVHLCAACLAVSMACDTEVSLAAACLWRGVPQKQ